VKREVYQVRRKQTTYVQNVRLWLKHKLESVLAIGQLHHQSATAPRCTTPLRDVRGQVDQVNRFRAPFLTIFVSCSY